MAKKVGILFGMEDTFPWAFIDKVNELGKGEVVAEAVMIDKLEQGADYGYAVIIDRISQDVPFYRAYLKNAAVNGTYVMELGATMDFTGRPMASPSIWRNVSTHTPVALTTARASPASRKHGA